MNLPPPRTIASFLALVATALASSYLLSSFREDEEKTEKPKLSMAYYLDKASLTGTGPDGEVMFQVWTKRAAQSMDDTSIDMETVRLVYGPPTALPWEVRANEGRIPPDISRIELRGNVVAISAAEGQPPTVIRTERLDVNPTTRDASTDADVTLEFGGRVVDATGMQANFETNDVQLLSNVHGRFLPNK